MRLPIWYLGVADLRNLSLHLYLYPVSTSSVYSTIFNCSAMSDRYASYREMLNTGLFTTEANCSQYLFDIGILPQQRRCHTCSQYMMIRNCSETKYREGCCWECCSNTVGLRVGSVLGNSNLSYKQFIDILAEFSRLNSERCGR